MTTKPTQPSGDDPGPEPTDRIRTPSGTSSTTGRTTSTTLSTTSGDTDTTQRTGTGTGTGPAPDRPAPDPAAEQLAQLVGALKVLPRRLAQQRLGDDERYHVPEFDALYAAMMGASNIINGRTAQLPYNPATTAHWHGTVLEDHVLIDTRLVDGPPDTIRNPKVRIDLEIGPDTHTYRPEKPHGDLSPQIVNRRLQIPVRTPAAAAGPFKVHATISYQRDEGKVVTRRFTTVAQHRLSLPGSDDKR